MPAQKHPASPHAARPAPGGPPARTLRRGRLLAAAALALFGLLVVTVVVLAFVTQGLLVVMVAGVSAVVVVVAACGWWALTTRRPWKRRLNLLVAAVLLAAAALAVVVFSRTFAAGLVILAILTFGYAEAARRALATADARVPGRVTPPPARPWLLVNPRSGDGKAARLDLAAVARERGVQVHELMPGEDAQALARAAVAAGADAVGAAAGDGTLGSVAAVAVENGLPFLCIPTGTRNHFAADLGLDRAHPLSALDALGGRERRIDVGTVGGRVFLNNVSMGAYADIVGASTYREDRLGTARAVLPEMLRAEHLPLDVRFRLPDGQLCRDALVVLVANNPYGAGPLEAGSRVSLDGGLLQVSVLRARTGAQIAGALARMASARGEDATTWARWTAPGFRLETSSQEMRVAIDGDPAVLAGPLAFRTCPRALRVLVPSGPRPSRLADLLAPLRWSVALNLWTLARTGGPR
jgi:diacylglycerol kinase family enzyme